MRRDEMHPCFKVRFQALPQLHIEYARFLYCAHSQSTYIRIYIRKYETAFRIQLGAEKENTRHL